MNSYSLGIDIGSVTTKFALLDERLELAGYRFEVIHNDFTTTSFFATGARTCVRSRNYNKKIKLSRDGAGDVNAGTIIHNHPPQPDLRE